MSPARARTRTARSGVECTNYEATAPPTLNISLHSSRVAHQAGAYPGFRSMKRLRVFLLPLDGMLVHRRVTPSIKFVGTHLYTWVERGTVRVNCLAQEHNAMSPARARTQTARFGDERTNHEVTAPPTSMM